MKGYGSGVRATESAARSGDRLSPDEIEDLYSIDETLTEQTVGKIAIVDDVLTTGGHFRAAKNVLSAKFPNVPIVGLFIARRAIGSSDV